MDIMFDTLFILSKHDSEYKLRVPLSCLVDYKVYLYIINSSILDKGIQSPCDWTNPFGFYS
jgi:hypothetical protein